MLVNLQAETSLASEDTPPAPAAAQSQEDTTGSVLADIKLVNPAEEPTLPKFERELGGSPAADRRAAMEAVKKANRVAAERNEAWLTECRAFMLGHGTLLYSPRAKDCC